MKYFALLILPIALFVECFSQNCYSYSIINKELSIFIEVKDSSSSIKDEKKACIILKIFNNDTVPICFAVSKYNKSDNLLVYCSENSIRLNLLRLYVSTCNEDNYPLNCKDDSLTLKVIKPKEMISGIHFFNNPEKLLSQFIENYRLDFALRYLRDDINCMNQNIGYKKYYNLTKYLYFSFNTNIYNKNVQEKLKNENSD